MSALEPSSPRTAARSPHPGSAGAPSSGVVSGVALGAADRAKAAAKDGDGVPCTSCGMLNAATVNFCRSCGASLGAKARAAASAVAAAAAAAGLGHAGAAPHGVSAEQSAGSPPAIGRVACSNCGEQTPSGFAFCQHCGHRLREAELAQSLSPRSEPAQRPRLPNTDLPPPSMTAEPRPGAKAAAPRPAPSKASPGLFGRLVALRRDGSDGDAITLGGEVFDLGRSEGSKCFTDDPFMAPRHARFFVHGGGVRVRPLDAVNGVFVQIHEPYELHSGDVFYIGRELLRFEVLLPEERDPPPAVEHGVRVFGSALRESWGRLRQITGAATVRDLWHLSRSEILLGREEGDIVFPDDEFMSRRHALLTRSGQRVRLEDQHSSNGTYVRLRGERELQPGDVLRVGDQVLRFEPQ